MQRAIFYRSPLTPFEAVQSEADIGAGKRFRAIGEDFTVWRDFHNDCP